MTTAHRATYNPARGSDTQGGYKRWTESETVSVHRLPTHTKLKKRYFEKDVETDKTLLVQNLEEKERKHFEKSGKSGMLMLEYSKTTPKPPKPDDQSEPIKTTEPDSDDDSDEDLSDDSDSESDDEEDLLRELEKIKKEREAETKKRKEQRKVKETSEILSSNPLLQQNSDTNESTGDDGGAQQGNFKLKRKWNDYSVFKNQAIGEPKTKKRRFINDTIRNDFHREFLDKTFK